LPFKCDLQRYTTDRARCDELLQAVFRELTAAAMGEDEDGW
jgi:hypothetical protein